MNTRQGFKCQLIPIHITNITLDFEVSDEINTIISIQVGISSANTANTDIANIIYPKLP